MSKEKILVIGANGQIGSVLADALQEHFGTENIIASDIRHVAGEERLFEEINVLDAGRIAEIVDKYKVTQIYHLAAILSAKGEAAPLKTWDINMSGLFNVLEVARERSIKKVFFPSSIAVFGKNIPRQMTPQNALLLPETVYGMSKVAGELWSQYYHGRYGLDVRSIRYPGVVGWQSDPGGGTTDYAVEIYHAAVQEKPFTCFLSENTALPMIYMEDAIRATLELMDAPADSLNVRTSYNLAGMSFTPAEIADSIKSHFPAFEINYAPDFRQKIADGWPQSIDDCEAKKDWNWQPRFDLAAMTQDMLEHLTVRQA